MREDPEGASGAHTAPSEKLWEQAREVVLKWYCHNRLLLPNEELNKLTADLAAALARVETEALDRAARSIEIAVEALPPDTNRAQVSYRANMLTIASVIRALASEGPASSDPTPSGRRP